MSQREQILQQAMQLPPDDRAYVADVLEQSLNGIGFATPELTEAWAVEIERRISAYDRGELPATDGDSALNRVRQALADFRARKVAS
jgi:putative addiction module component (TIGR02574 family)